MTLNERLDQYKNNIPEDIQQASIYVSDTLAICKSIATDNFKKEEVTPEIIIAIYDRVIEEFCLKKSDRAER